MTSRLAVLAALTALAACGGRVPDSNPSVGGGVGFGDYDRYQTQRFVRERELSRASAGPISEERVIASETLGVLNATRPVEQTQVVSAPVTVTPQPAPAAGVQVASVGNPDISDEQNFDAVATRETIESDAQRLVRQRDAFEVVQPEALPSRPGDNAPNIVAYALSTNNLVGQQVHRRSGSVSNSSFQRACAKFTTSDKAQEEFLNSGGPKTDRRGLDPDGDGFACYWDPMPFRAARGG
ncbi:MAG: hypothetical protein KJO42_07760 [Silicimonas sp.]|nr:hypothetical protein [Silicimonas sp.]NNL73325.1 hypothetical protein [Silicimonas sp.]